MTSKSFLCGVLPLWLVACAVVPKTPEPKLTVTHVGSGSGGEHVFCETSKCPQPTPKYFPAPLPQVVTQPRATPPVVIPPAVNAESASQPERFKVHFRWGWSRLDEAGRKELQAVLGTSGLKTAAHIEVAGRTDPTGSRKLNEKLALRRAETVKAALIKAGIPAERIAAVAQAPCCDGNKQHPDSSAMRDLRRTDLDITIKTK